MDDHDDHPPAILPSFVRELLGDDNLERAEEDLRMLVGHVGLPREGLELLVPSETGGVVDSVESLTISTTIDGKNDPRMEGAARPWLYLIGNLLGHDPEGAGRAARGWYTTLMRVNFEMDGDPLPHRAIAAYVAGIIEAYLFNDVKAEHWLEVGHSEAEADGDIWVPLFLATRFVRGAVRST